LNVVEPSFYLAHLVRPRLTALERALSHRAKERVMKSSPLALAIVVNQAHHVVYILYREHLSDRIMSDDTHQKGQSTDDAFFSSLL
jgi:hypothetical protein